MKSGGTTDALLREGDQNYVKFTKLLARAVAEGRVDGRFRCPTCGMRYRSEAECLNCCAQVDRSA